MKKLNTATMVTVILDDDKKKEKKVGKVFGAFSGTKKKEKSALEKLGFRKEK